MDVCIGTSMELGLKKNVVREIDLENKWASDVNSLNQKYEPTQPNQTSSEFLEPFKRHFPGLLPGFSLFELIDSFRISPWHYLP